MPSPIRVRVRVRVRVMPEDVKKIAYWTFSPFIFVNLEFCIVRVNISLFVEDT